MNLATSIVVEIDLDAFVQTRSLNVSGLFLYRVTVPFKLD